MTDKMPKKNVNNETYFPEPEMSRIESGYRSLNDESEHEDFVSEMRELGYTEADIAWMVHGLEKDD